MIKTKTYPKKAESHTRLTRNSKLFKTILQGIFEKKGENIVSLDLRKVPEAVADFFIICEATTNVQARAIIDFVQDEVRDKCSEAAWRREGSGNDKWMILDYISIVLHVMLPDSRKFYQLEENWHDAPLMEHADNEKNKTA